MDPGYDRRVEGPTPSEFAASFKAFLDLMAEEAQRGSRPLQARLASHLGVEPAHAPVVAEELPPHDLPNLQLAVEALTEGAEIELRGLAASNKRFMPWAFSDLLGAERGVVEGPVDYVNVHLAAGRVLPCVRFGLYLVSDGRARLAVFIAGPPEGGNPNVMLRVEVAANAREHAEAFLARLRQEMADRNVYRGQVVSLEPGSPFVGPPRAHVSFHDLASIDRDRVVLPAGVLERIEQQTVVFAEHARALRAAGRSLKRGLLLHGAPGTGKTHTIRYLCGRMRGRTVILISGRGVGLLQTATQLARTLTPAMLVIEDVDLIAEERTMPGQRAAPLLFELLNEMDGLADDADLIFVLTTNRPEILEPALAARPGRIDLAVELPLPDQEGRRRLLELYGRGIDLEAVDLTAVAARIDGATPAYIKELLRRAALISLSQGGAGVGEERLQQAIEELEAGGELARRLLGLNARAGADGGGAGPTGFPAPAAIR